MGKIPLTLHLGPSIAESFSVRIINKFISVRVFYLDRAIVRLSMIILNVGMAMN